MYGLPQAGRIAKDCLVKHLAADGYTQSKHPPGLFRHKTHNITFALIVVDFGVQYAGLNNAQHLIDVLKKLYRPLPAGKATNSLAHYPVGLQGSELRHLHAHLHEKGPVTVCNTAYH
jgi:hypothetical protein